MADKLTCKWIKQAGGNFLLTVNAFNADPNVPDSRFFVSYQSDTTALFSGLLAGDTPDETAIWQEVMGDDKRQPMMILNGDWRRWYEAVVDDGFEALVKIYNDNKAEHGSSWSEA